MNYRIRRNHRDRRSASLQLRIGLKNRRQGSLSTWNYLKPTWSVQFGSVRPAVPAGPRSPRMLLLSSRSQEGWKARNVIAWAEASLASAGPGRSAHETWAL